MDHTEVIDLTFIRRWYYKIKAILKINSEPDKYYDFDKNLYYGKREYKKIHSQNDSKLEKRFKSFIAFWGSVGYLSWEYLIENNEKNLSSEELEVQLIKMGNCYTNDKNFDELDKKDKDNRNEKKKISIEIFKNLAEKDFTETLNKFIHRNDQKNIVAIKFLTPRADSKGNIKCIEDLEKERWMSFTILPKAKFSSVCKNPFNYLLQSSVGFTIKYEYMIIEIPLGFEFIKTNNLCDINEILINSSKIITNKEKIKYAFILE